MELLVERQVPDSEQFGLRLALEEAIVNALRHGNQMDPSKSVRIACEFSPNCVRIEIEDEGAGYNPADVPDPTTDENLEKPSGRGLMLMRAFVTSVTVVGRGNLVILEKTWGG